MSFSGGTGCPVIAEIAQAHDGSLGAAHAYIDAVAAAGADAIKFQTHIADAESTPGEPWRVKFSRQDASRFEYWKRMEFTEEQWTGLATHARERGLMFLSSAFSVQAFELLERIGMPAWKIGAGEVTNLDLIERMARTGKPVWLSTGMASWQDLDLAVAAIQHAGGSYAMFQCTTAYPCPPEKLGLNVIAQLRERYGCPVGLSDHSGTIYAGLAAASLGADMIELHTVFSRSCFGPDTPASVTLSELGQLVEGVRFIRAALNHPVDKMAMADDLSELRAIFGKSVVAAQDLPVGSLLCENHLAMKKAGAGIPAAGLKSLVGRRLKRQVALNTAFAEDDFEPRQSS